jgi:phage terminase large subunit-like protein
MSLTADQQKQLKPLMAKAKREGWAEWVRTGNDHRAMLNGCTFDKKAGRHVVAFFRNFLRHSKGRWAKQPFELMPEQRDKIIMPLFGWKRSNGFRRFNIAYISVAKKNFKSTMCAGIANYLLLADKEQGAEVYSAAADIKQANIVFDEAAKMIEASPALKPRVVIRRSVKTMAYHATGSKYEALSADAFTKEGLNIHGLIFDELHAQPNRSLWDALRYGGAARDQPLIIAITTAGFDRHSICYEQYDYAKKVQDPKQDFWDDSFFVYIAEADEDDDWTDREVWKKANPGLGDTVSWQSMEDAFTEAQQSPAKELSFRRYRLNQWTQVSAGLFSMDKWDACDGHPLDLDDFVGRECFLGLDLASVTDIAAGVLVAKGRKQPDGSILPGGYDVLPRFWVPAENAQERSLRDRVPYGQWIAEDRITATEGNRIDYDVIRRDINELGEQVHIREISIDAWNSTQLQAQLDGDGFEIVQFGQRFKSMSAPTKELVALVIAGELSHGSNPVLRWMAGNTAAETDAAGNLKPSKKHSTEKIDGIVALIMALGRAMVLPEKQPSVYESRGALVYG